MMPLYHSLVTFFKYDSLYSFLNIFWINCDYFRVLYFVKKLSSSKVLLWRNQLQLRWVGNIWPRETRVISARKSNYRGNYFSSNHALESMMEILYLNILWISEFITSSCPQMSSTFINGYCPSNEGWIFQAACQRKKFVCLAFAKLLMKISPMVLAEMSRFSAWAIHFRYIDTKQTSNNMKPSMLIHWH